MKRFRRALLPLNDYLIIKHTGFNDPTKHCAELSHVLKRMVSLGNENGILSKWPSWQHGNNTDLAHNGRI